MTMTHPGLPESWAWAILLFMVLFSLWGITFKRTPKTIAKNINLNQLPLLGPMFEKIGRSPWFLLFFKFIIVAIFLLIIVAGLFGTPIPERNIATVLTWNIWWSGLIIAIFFIGSAWCAVCPWDTLASWLVRRKLFRRREPNNSLNLKIPKPIRTVWPALLMFIGLTWLELGYGVTTNPYATASLALIMVVLTTISLSIFQRKSFCRHFCPVGRTIGFYSQLSVVELRPTQINLCETCETLECFHGNQNIEPCPTHLVMGSLQQNTYCTSCGNCLQSCPHQNVGWRIRPPSEEAIHTARPHQDEAWFMIGLLALTGFHGITMMPFWEKMLSAIAGFIGDSGQLLWSFSIGLTLDLFIVTFLYCLTIVLLNWLSTEKQPFSHNFTRFAFVTIPIAFAYHIAHNLNHIVRESADLSGLFKNPLGIDTLPLTTMEKHQRHFDMIISQDTLFFLQASTMILGFAVAILVIRSRSQHTLQHLSWQTGWRLLPIVMFAITITGFHLWLMTQPMIMRM